MSKRKKINQRRAKRLFTVTASHTRGKNNIAVPMRGGYRL